jgi:hypothetical protein
MRGSHENLAERSDVEAKATGAELLLDVQSALSELALKVTPPSLPFSKGEG